MKAGKIAAGVMLGFLATAQAAELLWANFDSDAVGPVSAVPGWARAEWVSSSQTGQVSSAGSYSDSHCLELPWHANGCTAVYTNFNSDYNPTHEHPVIRCSAKIFTPNTNMFFQLGLRHSASSNFLSFEGRNGYGVLGTTTHDSGFYPLVSNRFVDVTLFYNRSNNHYRLDYNGTNRLAWSTNNAPAPLVFTQFNQFVVTRLTNSASTTGLFLIDNVRVETFPPHVWAWWRCGETDNAIVEQLGTFMPTQGSSLAVGAGASEPVFDGTNDFHNDGARRGFYADPANAARATPAASNWTVETVFRMAPGDRNVCFIDWGKSRGFDTNGARICFGFASNSSTFYFALRDDQQADSSDEYNFDAGEFEPDGRWHHLAFVKYLSVVSVYLDYQQLTNISLTTGHADGTYTFGTQSRASIGQALNFGNNCGPGTVLDEIRVSGRNLETEEFLQPGQPYLVEIMNSATSNPWRVAFKGILGRTYRAETSPVFGPGATWSPAATATVAATFGAFNLPASAQSNFVRILRQ